MTLFSCQLALFVESGSVRADELSVEVRRGMDLGSYEPMLIPEAPGMPEEFPRLQINTSKGYQLTMSKLRIDFFMSLPLGLEDKELTEFHQRASQLLGILGSYGFSFSRVGLICNYFLSSTVSAKDAAQKFLKVDSDDVAELNFSITKRFERGGRLLNNLYNFASGASAHMGDGYVLVRDVNTVPHINYSMSPRDIEELIDFMKGMIDRNSVSDFVR